MTDPKLALKDTPTSKAVDALDLAVDESYCDGRDDERERIIDWLETGFDVSCPTADPTYQCGYEVARDRISMGLTNGLHADHADGRTSPRTKLERLRDVLEEAINRIEDDRREPDKLLCHVQWMKREFDRAD